MIRRPLLTALVTVASTVTGLAIYAYLWAAAMDERDAADDAAVLRDLSRGCRISIDDGERIANALVRLHAEGLIVRREAAYYLTRAGWARVGKPLSDHGLEILQCARRRDYLTREQWRAEIPAWPRYQLNRVREMLEERLMLKGGTWDITPAGRAVLGEASS